LNNSNPASWGRAENSGKDIESYISQSQLQTLQGMMAVFESEEIEFLMLMHPQITCPVIHTFGPGVYVRELSVPGGGTFLVGHKQRYEQLNIFLKGRLLMFSAEGKVKEISAPMMFTGGPGKKTGIVLEDMTWMNVFSSDETDIDTLENIFFEKSETWKKNSRRNVLDLRNHGYEELLKELGMTRERMDYESHYEENQTTRMPYGSYKCGVHKSPIHGRGIMTTATIYRDECIGAALVNGVKTPFGRYCNHSNNPNAYPFLTNNDLYFFANQEIIGSFGGALGEEILVDYRKVKCLL